MKPKLKQFGVWQEADVPENEYFATYGTLNEAVAEESKNTEDGLVEVFELTAKPIGVYQCEAVAVKKRARKK